MREDSGSRLFRVAFILVALVKVFLVADQEIHGARFDDMGYAQSMIDHYYGCDPDLNWMFIRPPGYPLFGALCMESGLPYRICIELFMLGAAGFLCAGLGRALPHPSVPVVCLVALVFHPWVLAGFNQLLTEPYYLCLALFLLGVLVRLLAQERWRWTSGLLWGVGPLVALMMLTRREGPWVFGLLLLAFALHFMLLRLRGRAPWRSCLAQMLLLVVPLAGYQAVMLGVSGLNYLKWGVFATNEQEAPGFSGLLDALYEIDTPDPSLWAPVTARTLEMAMAASPRLAQLRDGLFDGNNPHLEYGEHTTGRKGELGAWMWWRLYESLAGAGIYTSPKAADEWMRAATAELRAALDDGRLPERRFSTSFPVDPNIGTWLPELPRLFFSTFKRLHFNNTEADWRAREAAIPSMFQPVFDTAANRRVPRIAANSVEVTGHAFSSAGRLDFIAVEDPSGVVLASASPRGQLYWKRRDIEALTGREGIFDTSFHISFVPESPGPYTLGFWKDGVRLHRYGLGPREFPHRVITPGADGVPRVDFTVTAFRSPFPDHSASMRALLRGWAFCRDGAITHVSLVNGKGEFLKLQPFLLEREDIAGLYATSVGSAPPGPLGFHIETPVLDLSPITVQFWKDSLLVHELPLDGLPGGYYGTVGETRSGIPLTIGIGRRQLPELAVAAVPLRKAVRAHIAANYYLYCAAAAALAFAWRLLARRREQRAADPWLAGALVALLSLFLVGRAAFYGLVEAAVVPDQSRYMDCASPVFGMLLALVLLLAGALIADRLGGAASPAKPAQG